MNLVEQWINKYLLELQNIYRYSTKTVLTYQHGLEDFKNYFKQTGLENLNDFNYSMVRGYLMHLYENKLSPSSVRLRISILRSFYRFLIDQEQVSANPFEAVTLPKVARKNPEFLYQDEINKVIDQKESKEVNPELKIRDHMLFELLYATGLRIGEVILLQLEDFDFDQNFIRILGKGSKERYVPFNSLCKEWIEDYLENSRKVLMERYQENHMYFLINRLGQPISEKGAYNIVRKLAKNQGLQKNVHPHMLRHSFASDLLSNGADIRIVQEMLGHSSLSTTQIYTHISTEKLNKTYQNAHPLANKDPNKKY